MLSHDNMRAAWRSVQAYLHLREDDVIGLALPMTFSYGLYHVIMGLGLGATIVIERSVAFPVKLLQRFAAERVTVFPGVPTLFASLLGQDLAAYDLGALRIATNAAAALPIAHLQRLRQAWPQMRFFAMYGLTECKRASYLAPEDIDARPASVGRGMPFQRHWLVDEDGRDVTVGGVGQLVVAGPHVMQGYWRRPGESAEKLRPAPDGTPALYTGDIFRSDADGYLYFVSRSDDIIKSRGEKVSPVEVEHAICGLPGVIDAAVVGVPDELLGEAVQAYVRIATGVQLTERDVIRHCLATLESFMAPKRVVFVEELPITDSGKVQRSGLRNLHPPTNS
jgi:acyl-CoA synthetase (AMP-forming)/AMP-acid ligase II